MVLQPALSATQRQVITNATDSLRLAFASDEDEAVPFLREAAAVAGPLSDSALSAAESLRWIHSWAAGPHLTSAMRERSGLTVTSSKGNGGIPLAEHALMLMLMLDRDAPRSGRAQQSRTWDRFEHGELSGRTCGIIGLGHAGSDLARKARAFHMRVLGVRRNPGATAAPVDRVYSPRELHGFLGEVDFLVVTAPLTEETAGMLGETEFRLMKRSSYYICVSRGGIAAGGALEQALREGWIAGAGLDAHEDEPLPSDSPFWDLRNTIVTAHHGANTPQKLQRGVDIFVENLQRFVSGRPLHNCVDLARGY